MDSNEITANILNDLIKANNERVAGFRRAGESLENEDIWLRHIFYKLAGESRANVAELSLKACEYNAGPERDTNISGTLHHTWPDVKSSPACDDLESILDKCERRDIAIEQAYNSALENLKDLPYGVVELLIRQRQAISEAYGLIRSLRSQSHEKSKLQKVVLF